MDRGKSKGLCYVKKKEKKRVLTNDQNIRNKLPKKKKHKKQIQI